MAEEKKKTTKTKTAETTTEKKSTGKKKTVEKAEKTTKSATKNVKSPTVKSTTPKTAKPTAKKENATEKSVKTAAEKKTEKTVAKKAEKKPVKTVKPTTKKAESKPTKKKAATERTEKKETTKSTKKETKTAEKKKKVVKKAEKSTKKTLKSTKNVKIAEDIKPEPKNIKILGYHDLLLNTYVYDNVKSQRAVVLIVHGMQEHCLRYKPFAEFLSKKGYIVIMSDLRGHGRTMTKKEDYGCGEKDIFQETIQDQLALIEFAHREFNLPIYLFAHSYGSMITQNLVQISPYIEKAVLCGTGNGDSLTFKFGSMFISFLHPVMDENERGGIAEKLCLETYANNFKDGNWLTRDSAEFEKYLADEYCGGAFPFSFYFSLVKNMRKTNKGISKIGNKKLFLIAGSKDPVGESGKQVEKLLKLYLKNNIDAKMKIYPEARHELLNELNKDEVYADVLKFYED